MKKPSAVFVCAARSVSLLRFLLKVKPLLLTPRIPPTISFRRKRWVRASIASRWKRSTKICCSRRWRRRWLRAGSRSPIVRTRNSPSRRGTGIRKEHGATLAAKDISPVRRLPPETIRYSYGYALPRRGFTRNDGTDNVGFSRLTDGDLNTFWKSNPYLTQRFTGESDALHPQWVVLDLAQVQQIDSIRIAWGEPYARRYVVQYWTGDDPIKAVTRGVWQTFPQGTVQRWKRRDGNDSLEQHSHAGAIFADMDDGVIEHLRRRWARRSAELCRLCDSRTLPRHHH